MVVEGSQGAKLGVAGCTGSIPVCSLQLATRPAALLQLPQQQTCNKVATSAPMRLVHMRLHVCAHVFLCGGHTQVVDAPPAPFYASDILKPYVLFDVAHGREGAGGLRMCAVTLLPHSPIV